MAILNRSDEVERLVDAVIIAAQKFVQSKSDSISDADIKGLFAKRQHAFTYRGRCGVRTRTCTLASPSA